MSQIPTDYLQGQWEFPTEIGRDGEGYFAKAMGYEARHATSQDQALNDLNIKLNDAMDRGELHPDIGF